MSDQLAHPPSAEDRARQGMELMSLHPANRFRLMFGQPLLPDPEYVQGRPHKKTMQEFIDQAQHESNS